MRQITINVSMEMLLRIYTRNRYLLISIRYQTKIYISIDIYKNIRNGCWNKTMKFNGTRAQVITFTVCSKKEGAWEPTSPAITYH